jgi:hypothetical protein
LFLFTGKNVHLVLGIGADLHVVPRAPANPAASLPSRR